MRNGLPFSILVVEDDEDDRQMMDEAFKEIGYEPEVKKFIDGQKLLHYLEQIEPSLYPHLIVLDNTLPGLDATEVLRILKSNPTYQSIPVVVYSTLITPFKKEQLLKAGAIACFEKASTTQDLTRVATDLKNIAEHHMKK